MAKTLCDAHTEEKRKKGTLPDRGHIHENERNLGGSEENDDDEKWIQEPPNDGQLKNRCLLVSLILARSRQCFIDRPKSKTSKKTFSKKSRKKNIHPDHIDWELIYRFKKDTKNRQTPINNLKKNMKILLKKCPALNGDKLNVVIPKFCEYFGDVNVFVICPEFSLQRFKYTFPPEGASLDRKHNIFLYQEKNTEDVYHVKYIPCIRMFSRNFGGLECIFGCGNVRSDFQLPHSNCKFKTCDTCKFPIEPNGYFLEGNNLLRKYHCDGFKGDTITCKRCGLEFGSEFCFKKHKRCNLLKYKCKQCGKIIYPRKNRPVHKCGFKTCEYCKRYIPNEIPKKINKLDDFEAIHQCPYKAANLPNKMPNLGFFTLAIGEEHCCINCQEKEECKLHENLKIATDFTAYSVVIILIY